MRKYFSRKKVDLEPQNVLDQTQVRKIVRDWMIGVYQKKNPSVIPKIPYLLTKFHTREGRLIFKIKERYKIRDLPADILRVLEQEFTRSVKDPGKESVHLQSLSKSLTQDAGMSNQDQRRLTSSYLPTPSESNFSMTGLDTIGENSVIMPHTPNGHSVARSLPFKAERGISSETNDNVLKHTLYLSKIWALSVFVCCILSVAWLTSVDSLAFIDSLYVFMAFFSCPLSCKYEDVQSNINPVFIVLLAIFRILLFIFGIYLLCVYSLKSKQPSSKNSLVLQRFVLITIVYSLGGALILGCIEGAIGENILYYAVGSAPLTPKRMTSRIWLIIFLPIEVALYARIFVLFLIHLRDPRTTLPDLEDGYLRFN